MMQSPVQRPTTLMQYLVPNHYLPDSKIQTPTSALVRRQHLHHHDHVLPVHDLHHHDHDGCMGLSKPTSPSPMLYCSFSLEFQDSNSNLSSNIITASIKLLGNSDIKEAPCEIHILS